MSSGEDSTREEELAIVNLENVKRISETYQPRRGKGKNKNGSIPKSVVQELWKDRLSPRFYSRLMSVMFPEDSNEVSFLSFYTIYKNLTEPETEIMFRALTIYHIATIHEPPFNYETANEYPNASYKAIKDYVCDVITSYLHAIINVNMKEAHAWLGLRASNTLIDGNLAAAYVLKDLETHRNEVSIGSLEIWLEKNEIYYTVSEQLFLYLFGVNSYADIKPLIPLPVVQISKVQKTLLALPDVLLLNSKLRRRAQRWTLAYILDRHSQNWETFKEAIYGKGQTLIVIQDANGDIFGMYGSQRWVPTEGFFGNDECFLFTLKPDVNIYEGSGRDNNFQLFNESGIGMGGTEDKPGLFIQSDTVKGKTSLACRTFREFWPLAKELEFKICQIEVWTMDGAETKVEEDVGDLIRKTQYMKMGGDEECDETKRVDSPKQQQIVQAITLNKPVDMQGVTTCGGECAMDTLKSPPKSDPSSKHDKQQVCCSKQCPKKIKLPSRDRNGEVDGDVGVCPAHKVPSQEEKLLHRKYSVEEVKVKTEIERKSRKSFDAQQKHGADGFIHPSLAPEENERNTKGAAEAAKRNETESLHQTKKRSNKPRPSRIRRLSEDLEPSQKSFSPSSYNKTTCDNQTQVGESRLMHSTCRVYRHSNKCSCVKPTCACPPKESGLLPSGNKTTSETSIKSNKSSHKSKRPTQKVQILQNAEDGKELNAPIPDYLTSSSSLVLIGIKKDEKEIEDNAVSPEKNTLHNKSTSPTEKENPGNKSDREANVKFRTSHTKESEASNKQHKRETSRPDEKPNSTVHSMNSHSYPNHLSQDSMLPELDCRCSSESDSAEVEEVTKCDPASSCSCQIKLSKYFTETKNTNISDISLTDISSSVCSCILDDKKITTTSPAISSGRETQNLCKSSQKRNGSGCSNQMTDMAKLSAKNSNCILSKTETQLHHNSKRACRKRGDISVSPNKQAIPICRTTKDTQNLTNSRRYSEWSSASAIKDRSAMEEGTSKRNPPTITGTTASVIAQDLKKELQETGNSGSLLGSTSGSQYSQTKRAPRRSCGASCKCSLSPSYFPVFPEDFIKDDAEVCDCASYNDLRFPVIVDTPPVESREPSIKSIVEEPEKVQEPPAAVEEPKEKFESDDNDTIIILNVSKGETAAVVEKLILKLEEKTGDPKIKSILCKCKDLTELSSKKRADRETQNQNTEKILSKISERSNQ